MKASFFTSRRTARSHYLAEYCNLREKWEAKKEGDFFAVPPTSKFRSYQGMTKAVTKEKYPQCKQGYLRSDKLSECWIIWAAAVL